MKMTTKYQTPNNVRGKVYRERGVAHPAWTFRIDYAAFGNDEPIMGGYYDDREDAEASCRNVMAYISRDIAQGKAVSVEIV